MHNRVFSLSLSLSISLSSLGYCFVRFALCRVVHSVGAAKDVRLHYSYQCYTYVLLPLESTIGLKFRVNKLQGYLSCC